MSTKHFLNLIVALAVTAPAPLIAEEWGLTDGTYEALAEEVSDVAPEEIPEPVDYNSDKNPAETAPETPSSWDFRLFIGLDAAKRVLGKDVKQVFSWDGKLVSEKAVKELSSSAYLVGLGLDIAPTRIDLSFPLLAEKQFDIGRSWQSGFVEVAPGGLPVRLDVCREFISNLCSGLSIGHENYKIRARTMQTVFERYGNVDERDLSLTTVDIPLSYQLNIGSVFLEASVAYRAFNSNASDTSKLNFTIKLGGEI